MKPILPHNPEAEAAVIGALLYGASPDVVPLREDHFHGHDARLTFAAIRKLADENAPIDHRSVTAELRASGQLDSAGGNLARFLEAAPGGDAALQHYFKSLETARQQREAVRFSTESIPKLASFELPAAVYAEELAARCAPLTVATGRTASDIAGEIEADMKAGITPEAFPTGLAKLDEHFAGKLNRGTMLVVGGGTGGGKSALLVQAAATCAAAGHPVIYFSLEMPRKEVFNRVASAHGGVSQRGTEPKDFQKTQGAIAFMPLTIHDDIFALADIAAAIRTAARQDKAAVVVVDYIQLIEAPGETRELAVSGIARALKTLALSEKVVILTASQLNDDDRLRESRAIGQHADFVLIIGGKSIAAQNGISVCKFRGGPAGVIIPATLNGSLSRFE